MLEKTADAIEARRGRLIALLQDEAGKTLDDALAEVREAADLCRYYAEQARRICAQKNLPAVAGEANILRARRAGLFACISPWNFPLAIFVGQVAAALVAGNCALAKPAEQTPLVARAAVDLLFGAGVPESVLQFVPGDGAVGARLVADARIAGVVFTGSLSTAAAIQGRSRTEGGPSSPYRGNRGRQRDDRGFHRADRAGGGRPLASAFRSAGQRCSALRLLCLQEEIFERRARNASRRGARTEVGDPDRIETHVGPVIDGRAKARLDAALADYSRRDESLCGKRPGWAALLRLTSSGSTGQAI